MELKTKILLRNDTAQAWTEANPTLGKGEVGIELDTGKMKLGDGATEWSQLKYFKGDIEADLKNLDATKVFFKEDITLAGDYDKVGNIALNQGKLVAANKSVSDLFTEIFTKELNPSEVSPTVSGFQVTNNGSGTSFEAGTTVTPKWVSTFNSGSYTYKSTVSKEDIQPVEGTGIKATSWEVLKDSSQIGTSEDGTGTSFVLGDSKVNFTITAHYNNGNYALTNLNKLPKEEVRITAGTATATCSISTYRKMFAGSTLSESITSDLIRGLQSSRTASVITNRDPFCFNGQAGDSSVIFAYPSNLTTKEPQFEFFTLSWGPFYGFKEVSTVEVADVRGGENGKKTYKVYVYKPATTLPALAKFRVNF